jgi:GNAT superfamily N-acetyltransferase
MDTPLPAGYRIRPMQDHDVDDLIEICRLVYPDEPPYTPEQLVDHRKVFPAGQFIAEHVETGRAVGVQATLVVRWSEYGDESTWTRFTGGGTFLNHDPVKGRTLYGAEMMVHPEHQHHGLSRALIEATRDLVRLLGLKRIRAGSRIAGYHRHVKELTPEAYAAEVMAGRIFDPVLSIHLKEGWSFFGIAHRYLPGDAESGGAAALIEWVNPEAAKG